MLDCLRSYVLKLLFFSINTYSNLTALDTLYMLNIKSQMCIVSWNLSPELHNHITNSLNVLLSYSTHLSK